MLHARLSIKAGPKSGGLKRVARTTNTICCRPPLPLSANMQRGPPMWLHICSWSSMWQCLVWKLLVPLSPANSLTTVMATGLVVVLSLPHPCHLPLRHIAATLCQYQTTEMGRISFPWLCTLDSDFDPQSTENLGNFCAAANVPWKRNTSVHYDFFLLCLGSVHVLCTKGHKVEEIWKQMVGFVVATESPDISARNWVLSFPFWGIGRKGKESGERN